MKGNINVQKIVVIKEPSVRSKSRFQRVKIRVLYLSLSILMCVTAPTYAAATLRSPSSISICLLYYKVLGQQVPYDSFADGLPEVERANEFQKGKLKAGKISQLKDVYQSISETKTIQLNIEMDIGTYDADLSEYTVSGFGPNSYVEFICPDRSRVHVFFENGIYAQSWSLDPTAAEQVLKRNHDSRKVVASTSIDLISSDKPNGDNILVLHGKVIAVDYFSRFTNAQLGHQAIGDKK